MVFPGPGKLREALQLHCTEKRVSSGSHTLVKETARRFLVLWFDKIVETRFGIKTPCRLVNLSIRVLFDTPGDSCFESPGGLMLTLILAIFVG